MEEHKLAKKLRGKWKICVRMGSGEGLGIGATGLIGSISVLSAWEEEATIVTLLNSEISDRKTKSEAH